MSKALFTNSELALYTIDQIRALEDLAEDKYQISRATLMERAGMAAFKVLRENYRDLRRIVIVCGKGNNAGDGYVLARLLHKANLAVTVLAVIDPQVSLSDIAYDAFKAAVEAQVNIEPFVAAKLENYDLIVDALFGTGLQGEIKGPFKRVVTDINNSGKPILALDVPSGLNADSGDSCGETVRADITVTFMSLKQGLFTYKAAEFTGKVKLDRLSLTNDFFANGEIESQATLLDFASVKELLPKRTRFAHKGDFGHVLTLGGDYGMPGAVRMASESALRSGAGLVSCVTRPEHVAVVCSACPEIMCLGIKNKDWHPMHDLLERADVVAIGSGLGAARNFGLKLWKEARKSKMPLVVDADALNILARRKRRYDKWILTPHPGEAARLLKMKKSSDVQQDRFKAIRAIQKKYHGVVVLKGSGTLICDQDQHVYVCPYGNPGMAKAGFGDILTGIVAALVAQGLPILSAACLGVVLHSVAADQLVDEYGENGLLATDILTAIPSLLS